MIIQRVVMQADIHPSDSRGTGAAQLCASVLGTASESEAGSAGLLSAAPSPSLRDAQL